MKGLGCAHFVKSYISNLKLHVVVVVLVELHDMDQVVVQKPWLQMRDHAAGDGRSEWGCEEWVKDISSVIEFLILKLEIILRDKWNAQKGLFMLF